MCSTAAMENLDEYGSTLKEKHVHLAVYVSEVLKLLDSESTAHYVGGLMATHSKH